ncbi:MAG: APC family permease [Euryarchaeota archaeon]|jgi:Amino acid transporters|nr:APC family permease [Euryarchaeota archaeon]
MTNGQKSQKLNLFDVTNLVVGTTIGADIFIVSALASAYLGPASLVVFIVAGAIAILIALSFADAAALVPKVGGAFAYVCEAWGNFAGFLVGWPLWIAEVAGLAVMPVAFVRYLSYFVPSLTAIQGDIIKIVFIAVIAYINVRGVKSAGRVNDVLTIGKLAPLLLLIVAGFIWLVVHPGTAASNFTPFAPLGFSNFGPALIIIFWAYTGFELAVIPSGEVENPTKTLPKAMVIGMAIVTFFYIAVGFTALAVVNWTSLQFDPAPLATAGSAVLSYTPELAIIGGAILGLGALISITGFEESATLATARLSYAISLDGLFPKLFSRIHPRFGTPSNAIIVQSAIVLFAALIGNLTQLIIFAAFNLAFVYLATCAAVLTLRGRQAASDRTFLERLTGPVIPVSGIILSVFLMYECGITTVAFGIVSILIGIPIYVFYAPRTEITTLKRDFYSTEAVLERTVHGRLNLFRSHRK